MLRRYLGLLLCSLVLFFGSCGHGDDEWNAKIKELNKVQSDLDSEREAHRQTKAELQKAKDKIASLQKDLDDTKGQLTDLQAELGKAGTEADALRRAKQDAEERAKKYRAVFEKLKKLKEINLGVSIRHQQIIISLPGDVLFAKGSEFLSTEGKQVVMKVANLIKGDPDLVKRYYQVIGHTDNDPYVGNYKDNVGLSLMRAREVYQFLTTPNPNPKGQPGGGLDPQLWTAAGYGDQDPLEGSRDKQSPEQAKKNRRVEIAVLLDASQLLGLDQLEQENK